MLRTHGVVDLAARALGGNLHGVMRQRSRQLENPVLWGALGVLRVGGLREEEGTIKVQVREEAARWDGGCSGAQVHSISQLESQVSVHVRRLDLETGL